MDFSSYPNYSGRDSWLNTSERGLGNQATKYEAQLPWQSSSQTLLPDLLTPQPSYSGPGEDCFNGVSTSRSALSLLSNASNFLGTSDAAEFPCPSWDFKGNQANTSLHEMPPDMDLPQISQPSNSHYNRGLGSARLDNGRYHEFDLSGDYDSSVQHMNWSL